VCYGWQEFMTLQDAPESKDPAMAQQFPTYLDFYLDVIHNLQVAYHKRLVQVLDLHWYPEAQGGGKRITENDISPDSIEARLQAPRSLWDPGYVEKSWITQWSTKGQPIQLIPWVKEKIDKWCPGTQLAFSEYDYGAGNHVSGGIAQADVLGIFGKYGIFMSSYWGDLKPYNRAAFKLYRNYDGKNASIGDTAVSAATENVVQTSCYAATDSKTPGVLWVVVLNKSQKDSLQGKFKFQGKETYGSYEAYSFDANSPDIKLVKKDKVDKDHFDYSLPPLSATLFVCRTLAETPP
ncbi:MAG TPA: glycoside hydrolase family 44 protein, partial [bacterium]|nr:glycoside hydrolase family 44 protein [bacterium]